MKNFLNDKTSYIGLDYPNTDEAFAETKDKKKKGQKNLNMTIPSRESHSEAYKPRQKATKQKALEMTMSLVFPQ